MCSTCIFSNILFQFLNKNIDIATDLNNSSDTSKVSIANTSLAFSTCPILIEWKKKYIKIPLVYT